MILLTFIFLFTIAVSALCAALETMVLNATPLEVENLKKKSKQRGKVLEGLARNINRTISAISASAQRFIPNLQSDMPIR